MDKDLVLIKAIIEADYKRHINRFETSNETHDIVFLGDSIMAYAPLKKLNLSHIINQGIPGDTTIGVLNRLDFVYKAKPKHVFLHIGSNDLSLTGHTHDEIVNHIKMIVEKLKAKNINVYLLSITPVLQKHPKTNQTYIKMRSNETIDAINAQLKELKGINKYINVCDALKDEQNQLHEDYTTDGVHLNHIGYDVFFKTIKHSLDIELK